MGDRSRGIYEKFSKIERTDGEHRPGGSARGGCLMKTTALDERELTVRIVEEACGVKRPAGTDTESAYATIAETAELEQFQRIARVAIEFFRESEGAQ